MLLIWKQKSCKWICEYLIHYLRTTESPLITSAVTMLFIFKAAIFFLHFYELFPSITMYVYEDILHMALRNNSAGFLLLSVSSVVMTQMCLYMSPFWEKYVIFPNGAFTNSFILRLQIKILTNITFSLTFLLASLTKKGYLVFLDTWGLKKLLKCLPHLSWPYDSVLLPYYFFLVLACALYPVTIPLDCFYKRFSSHIALIILF